jgi:hypothetical protein
MWWRRVQLRRTLAHVFEKIGEEVSASALRRFLSRVKTCDTIKRTVPGTGIDSTP